MQNQPSSPSPAVSRRQFLKTSSLVAAAAAAAASFPSVLRAQDKQAINAIIIGLGGRGGGAGKNFLDAAKDVGVEAKIVAVADIFPEQAKRGTENFGVPEDKCFSGFDAYMKALAVPGVNYAILATPPGLPLRPLQGLRRGRQERFHGEARRGGRRRLPHDVRRRRDGENRRASRSPPAPSAATRPAIIETIKRIQDGAIGDIVTLRAYWVNGGPIWHRGRQGRHRPGEADSQLVPLHLALRRSYLRTARPQPRCLQLDHERPPGQVLGHGRPPAVGRQIRRNLGQFRRRIRVRRRRADVQLLRPDQARLVIRQRSGPGHQRLGSNPRRQLSSPRPARCWRFRGKATDPYVQEHIDLINAILNDTELNEAKQVTDSTLTAIMGREAAYSGAGVEWEAILNSKFAYGPEQLYQDCAKMQCGPFRTLQPPMPSLHNILKDPPVVPVVKA